MAMPTDIKTLLSGNVVEWARIEFKETWDPESSLKTICAFANDIDNWGGGYLVIGVRENGGRPASLPGIPLDKIDLWLKDMLNKCKRIHPEYLPMVEVADYQGKKFIVAWCPGGNARPYSSPASMAKENKERVCFIRKLASTIRPSDDELRELYTLSNQIPFDDRVNHNADLADMNITLIQQFLRETGSSLYEESKTMDFLELCQSMNLVSVLPEYIKPKNVGLMFFSFEPDKFFPYTQIDVVQFLNGVGGDQMIERTFKGPIHHQLREALLYIRNTAITEMVIKYPDRAEADRFFNYPYNAIEEALANAIYHRAYDIREPVEVRIEPDKIEILSFPGPDRSVTLEGLRTYKVTNRRYRNRRIGEMLKELHLTEGRNTGFRKILNALEHNGSPKPEFETDEAHSYFITRIFIHSGFKTQKNKSNTIQVNMSESSNIDNDDFDVDKDVVTGIDTSHDVNNESNSDVKAGADINSDVNTDIDTNSDINSDVNTGTDTNNDINSDVNTGTDTNNDIDSDVNTDSDADDDANSDVNANVEGNSDIGITEREKRVLSCIGENACVSIKEIADVLSISRSTVDRTLRLLKEKGLITRQGNTKNTRWILQ